MNEESYTDDADVSQLEQRIDELEATIRKMLPSRREAIGMGVAGLAGASLMSGTASAGSAQVGTIGTSSDRVDVNAEDIDVSDTITTQDLVVNGTATGPLGFDDYLESGDTIDLEFIGGDSTTQQFVTLYSGSAKNVLGGIINGTANVDWMYTFSDGTTLRRNGSGTSYSAAFSAVGRTAQNGELFQIAFLPPAKDVTKIEVANGLSGSGRLGAEVYFI